MADINDFKVLKNKCIKMYDYFGKGEFVDANDKARMGFYHLVLENIAGINEVNEIQNCIIDTEYNRTILKIDTDDLGIDAVCYRDEYIDGEKPIYLFNFKHVSNFKEATTKDNDISRSMKFIEYLDLSLDTVPKDIGKKVRDKIIDIRKKLDSNEAYRIYLYMVSNKLGDFAQSSIEHIKVLANNYGIKIINLSLDDLIKYIFDRRKATESQFMLSKDDFLSFEGDNKSTKKSFIAKMSLVDVVRIFSSDEQLAHKYNLEDDCEINDAKLDISLLYDNVRGYLEETVFNKNIRNTLRENHMDFFMFNNGITVTAEEITSEPKNSNEKYLFTLKNYQIVNGGQTIRTIFSYLNEIKETGENLLYRNTYILVRIFKIEKDSVLKNSIAEYTNSQNQISAYDLKSVDAIQIQIENYLKEHDILYVRKAGDVGEVSCTYKYRISKEELAQIIYATQGYPDRVTNVKIKLFTDYYDDIFPKDNFGFEKIVGYIENYFAIKEKYKKKGGVSKCFYVCYLVNAIGLSIDEAIRFLDDFIARVKEGKKQISIPRWLIQKNTRDAFVEEANKVEKRNETSMDISMTIK